MKLSTLSCRANVYGLGHEGYLIIDGACGKELGHYYLSLGEGRLKWAKHLSRLLVSGVKDERAGVGTWEPRRRFSLLAHFLANPRIRGFAFTAVTQALTPGHQQRLW